MSCKCLAFGLFVVVAAAGEAGAQGRAAAMRFKEMDRNGDGVVSQAEWRGSKRSFEVHDWNGDGRLSGDEVRVGGTRPRADQDPLFDSADREYVFADWTDRGFRALDHNRDGRITADEWHFDREGYRRADHNRDGVISRAEFLNETVANDEDDDRDDRFPDLDDDQDRTDLQGGMARRRPPLQCAGRQSRRIPEPCRDARQRTAGGAVRQRRRQPRPRHQPGRMALVACQLHRAR